MSAQNIASAHYFGAPPDAFGETHLEILGQKELILEGGRGLLLYEPEEIRISLGDRILAVTGRSLTLKTVAGESVAVTGFIEGVTFLTV